MSAGAIVAIIVAVAVVVVVIVAIAAARRRKLQQRFGPEYDRVVGETHSHRKADAELAERERRVRSLDIRPLDETAQAKYAGEWTAIQERFVDRGLRPDSGGPVGGAREHAGPLPSGTPGQPAGRRRHRLDRRPAAGNAALPGAVR